MTKLIRILMPAIFSGMFALTSFSSFADDDPPGGNKGMGGGKGFSPGQSSNAGKSKGASKGKQNSSSQAKNVKEINKTEKMESQGIFSSDDRKTINDFFEKNPSAFLPPGIAMNLERGKPLPPGIAKKNLPKDLEDNLYINPAYNYYLINNRVVSVDSTTGIIGDILDIATKTTE